MSDLETPTESTTAVEEPVHLLYASHPLSAQAPTVLHSGMTVPRYFAMHLMGAVFPVTAGLLLFGWRAIGVIFMTLMTAIGAAFIWRRVGLRGAGISYTHVGWLAILLSLTLPPHLFSAYLPNQPALAPLWPVIPAAAMLLVALTWLLGGLGSSRVHPVLLVSLFLTVLFRTQFVPHTVLQARHAFYGDVNDAAAPAQGPQAPPQRIRDPWISTPTIPKQDALWREPASQRLIFYTSGTERPDRSSLSLEDLVRDRMPPLEDLIIGGHPAPIGAASAVAVIIGGLFLLYHGLIDFRIPLLIFLTAFLSLLILPVPAVITDTAKEWHWLPLREPGIGWKLAVTFVNYEMLAGALPLVAFFFAPAPAVRPMYRRGRAVSAVLIGVLTAVFQLYVDVATGAYVALFAVSLLTPALDTWMRPRALV